MGSLTVQGKTADENKFWFTFQKQSTDGLLSWPIHWLMTLIISVAKFKVQGLRDDERFLGWTVCVIPLVKKPSDTR